MRLAIWVDDLVGAVMQTVSEIRMRSDWSTNLVCEFDVPVHQIGLVASIVVAKKGQRCTFLAFRQTAATAASDRMAC